MKNGRLGDNTYKYMLQIVRFKRIFFYEKWKFRGTLFMSLLYPFLCPLYTHKKLIPTKRSPSVKKMNILIT